MKMCTFSFFRHMTCEFSVFEEEQPEFLCENFQLKGGIC